MWNFWTAVLAKMHLADWIYFSNLTFLAEIFYLGNAIVLCQGEKSQYVENKLKKKINFMAQLMHNIVNIHKVYIT